MWLLLTRRGTLIKRTRVNPLGPKLLRVGALRVAGLKPIDIHALRFSTAT